MGMVGCVLILLDRRYVELTPGLLSINDLGVEAFRKELLEKDGIGEQMRKEMLDLVRMDREGAQINTEPIKKACDMWISLGGNNRQVYEEEFEKYLLEETAAYYRSFSEKLASENSVTNYLAEVEEIKEAEARRVSEYFDGETKEKILKVIDDVMVAQPDQPVKTE